MRRAAGILVFLLGSGALASACKATEQAAAPGARATTEQAAAPGARTTTASGRAPTDAGAEGDEFPGKPVVRLCRKEWTHEECCAFLCNCLQSICSDSARSQPGIASCASWCPALDDKAMRCHVFHCYVSISPTGGIKDHDSHCRHASGQLPGGGCPSLVYERPDGGEAQIPVPSP